MNYNSINITNYCGDTMIMATDHVVTTCCDYNEKIYLHHTNCPCCGGLLDGDEHSPSVKCEACGAKIWAKEVI